MADMTRQRFKSDKNREAFNRWRDHAIEQITSASSMMFGLASAGLAYSLTMLSLEKSQIIQRHLSTFRFFTWAFAISFIAAFLLVFNRLEGFRKTAEIVRARDARDAGESSNIQDVNDLREESGFIDAITWVLFYTQFLSFLAGGIGVIVFILQA